MDDAPKSDRGRIIHIIKYLEIGLIVLVAGINVFTRVANPGIINFYIDNNVLAYFSLTLGGLVLAVLLIIRFLIGIITLRTVDKAFFSKNFRFMLLLLVFINLIYLIATLLSSSPNLSVYGYYTNLAPNLFMWLALSVFAISLYTLSYKDADIQHKIYEIITYFFNIFSIVLFIAFVVNILKLDNISVSTIKTNLTINIEFAMFFSIFNTIVSLTKLLTARKDLEKFIAISSIVLSTILFSLIGNTAYVLISISIFVLLAWTVRQNMASRNTVIIFTLLFFFIQLITLFTGLRELKLASYALPFDESVNIATEAIQVDPLTGSGPNTFLNSFWKYRSEAFNANPSFNKDFSKPASEFLLILHDIGLPALILSIILIFILVRTYAKKSSDVDFHTSHKYLILLTFIIGVLFISSLSITIYLALIIIFVLYMTNSDEYLTQQGIVNYATNTIVETIPPEKNIDSTLAIVLNSVLVLSMIFVVIVIFEFGGYGIKYLSNEYTFGKTINELSNPATDTQKANEILAMQREIIKDRNNIGLRGDYVNNFALTNTAIVKYITDNNDDLTDYQDLISQLIETTILSTNKAVELYPDSVAEWRTRSKIYNTLAAYKGNSIDIAINSLIKAAQLSPNDPTIRLELAVLYINAPDNEKAIEQLKKAVSLKADYLEARVLLIRLYRNEGRLIDAFDDIRYFLENVPEEHIYYQQIRDIITEYQNQQRQETEN